MNPVGDSKILIKARLRVKLRRGKEVIEVKRFFEIVLLMLSVVFCVSCDIGWVTDPDDSTPIKPDYSVVEFKYRRILPILNLNAKDPTGDLAAVWSYTGGGRNTSDWEPIGENEWICSILLEDKHSPFYFFLMDMKVERVNGEAIAREVSARVKGSGKEWKELSCVQKNGLQEGEWTKLSLFREEIQVPEN